MVRVHQQTALLNLQARLVTPDLRTAALTALLARRRRAYQLQAWNAKAVAGRLSRAQARIKRSLSRSSSRTTASALTHSTRSSSRRTSFADPLCVLIPGSMGLPRPLTLKDAHDFITGQSLTEHLRHALLSPLRDLHVPLFGLFSGLSDQDMLHELRQAMAIQVRQQHLMQRAAG